MSDEMVSLAKMFPLEFLQDLVDLAMAAAAGASEYSYELDNLYQQTAALVHEIFLYRTQGAVEWELIPVLVADLLRHIYTLRM
jgi:hypothetical protein